MLGLDGGSNEREELFGRDERSDGVEGRERRIFRGRDGGAGEGHGGGGKEEEEERGSVEIGSEGGKAEGAGRW